MTDETENPAPTETPESSEAPAQTFTPAVVEEIRSERKKAEEVLENIRKESSQLAELRARDLVDGRADTVPTEKPKELTPKEYRKDIEEKLKRGEYDRGQETGD